ncbi:MAG TPA: thiamine-phosphate kinase [Burkholderiales bacterium]|nr:thiamine-phosphate kinase [Burkholderiales bacterium]
MLSEFDLINRYFNRPTRHTSLGVGDDAALLAVTPGHELAASTDTMVEGVHFFAEAEPDSLGHKVLAVNLSDMAAMGANPKWAMLALTVPKADEAWFEGFARGFFALAAEHDVDLIGGDTARGPRNICVQIMGEVLRGQALRRDGARVGDDIWVSGDVGAAAAAVAHLKGALRLSGPLLSHCLARLNRPAPRVALGRMLIGVANSAIDISDGLLGDLGHICERSGVGAAIEFAAIPCAAELMPLRGHALVTRAILTGGDDYELCFTAVAGRRSEIEALSARAGLALTRVGRIVAERGIVVADETGKPMSVQDGGFDHFR